MSVTVRRVGNLNQYSIVLCRTEQGTATAGPASPPGQQDYAEHAAQVGGHACRKACRKEWMERDNKNTKEGVFHL